MGTKTIVYDALDDAYENRSRILDGNISEIADDLQLYCAPLDRAKRRHIKKAVKDWLDLNEHLCI